MEAIRWGGLTPAGRFAILAGVMERKILVVEDQRDIADLIAMHLRDLGHQVDCVHDGGKGLDAARSGRYDLLVLDVISKMETYGHGHAASLKAALETAGAKIVLIGVRASQLDAIVNAFALDEEDTPAIIGALKHARGHAGKV